MLKKNPACAINVRTFSNFPVKSPAPRRKKPALNITVAPEVRDALEARAAHYDTSISGLISALAKVWCGLPLLPVEKAVEADLKRIMGREQFLSFLKAVNDALPDSANPVPCGKAGGAPEAWVLGADVGVLAFYQPNEANVGDIFTKASRLMAEFALGRIIVATTNGHTLDDVFRQRLNGAGIDLVSLADLRVVLREATNAHQVAGKGAAGGSRASKAFQAGT